MNFLKNILLGTLLLLWKLAFTQVQNKPVINHIENTQTIDRQSFTLTECENQFLKNNLLLLATHYNIEATKAQTIQAKIWDNPYFLADLNAINPKAKRVLDVGGAGQKGFAVQQLILLGHKRSNQIGLSQTNESIAEYQFQDLLRNLKYQLRQSFFTLYFNGKKIETLDLQISHIAELVSAFEVQVTKGNVPLKEQVRLQSLLITFRNDRNELVKSNIENQTTIRILINNADDIIPSFNENQFGNYQKENITNNVELTNLAFENRPDFLLNKKVIEANQWNLKWQNSLAKPDLTLGTSYDQRGGAFNNQINITAGIPLPIWNKNKGNIRLAEVTLLQAQADSKTINQRIKTEIATSVNKWKTAKTNLNQLPQKTINDFKLVYEGVLANYKKRNIEIIEFTDFMESFNTMSLQLFELQKNVVLSAEEINTVVNAQIF